jgi:hypothetical protein
LVDIAFQLLNDLFSQRIHMIELLREMQLLDDAVSISYYDEIRRMELELEDIVDKSEEWLF